MGLLIGAILILLALIGAPLFSVIAASAIFGFAAQDSLDVVAIEIYKVAEMPELLAIPFFTLAGYLLGESKAPKRLLDLSDAFLGWLPGGLAIVAISACALLTAFTGASGVTIIALGSLLVPAMAKAGYKENFNLGLVTSSGSLGLLFAPSLPLILYGVVAQQIAVTEVISIDQLFLAGIIPGMLMLVALAIYSGISAKQMKIEKSKWNDKNALSAIKGAVWELPLPFIVLGGIYGGFFAVSEAAVITLIYVLVVTIFIRKEISFKQFPKVTIEAMKLVGAILMILAVSLASTNLMIDTGVPQQIFNFIKEFVSSPISFLILLTIFLLILGMMLDIFSALIIVIPIVFPIAMSYGIHPVHLGILFLANMQLGYFTPPVGMNLFIASFRFKKPIWQLYKSTIPFFFILLGCVLLITFIPELSLFLIK